MVAFNQQDKHENRLDWKILSDGSIALYWQHEVFNENLDWFRQQHYQVISFDCERWASTEEMHADLHRKLSLPAYYGRNLDALNDCLGDLSVPDSGGMALALTRFDAYAKGSGATLTASGRPEAEIVLDLLARASRHFLLTGRRFVTLVQTDDPRNRFDTLGCLSAHWNHREWLNKNRGL
jgi:hypothetical protein